MPYTYLFVANGTFVLFVFLLSLSPLQPRRVLHLLISSSLLPAVIEQHSSDSYVIIYVSSYRNKTDHYFNLILEDQPGVGKFQLVNLTDSDIARFDQLASNSGFCKTFQFKYHLPGDHYSRSIAVYVKAPDCKYCFTDGLRDIPDISADYQTKYAKGYRVVGISSYEGYRGVQYLLSFKKSNASVIPNLFNPLGWHKNFAKKFSKINNVGYVTYNLVGTYFGDPGVGPTTYTMLSYRTGRRISKDSQKLLEFKNIYKRHFSQEKVKLSVADQMKDGMIPISAMVLYRRKKDSNIKMPTLYILFVKEGLEIS